MLLGYKKGMAPARQALQECPCRGFQESLGTAYMGIRMALQARVCSLAAKKQGLGNKPWPLDQITVGQALCTQPSWIDVARFWNTARPRLGEV